MPSVSQNETPKQRCCNVSYAVSFSGARCQNKASVQRDGNWYCGMHDPEKIKARRAEQNVKWAKQRLADNAARAAKRAEEAEQARKLDAFDGLLFCLEQILGMLPAKRDWLDPDIERLARAAIAKAEAK